MSTFNIPINQVILTGVVTDEPIVRYLAPDYPEVRLRLMTSEQLSQRLVGKTYEQRYWHRIVLRGEAGKYVETHVHEGDTISVAGRLEYATESDRAGNLSHITEIVCQHVQLREEAIPAQQTKASPSTPSSPHQETMADSPKLDYSDYSPSPDEDPLA